MQPPPISEQAPSPVQALPYAALLDAPRYANFGERLVAWFIDVAILAAVRFGLILAFGAIVTYFENVGQPADEVQAALAFGFFASLYLCAWPYYMLMEASAGQGTVGKRVMRIRVEDVDGGRATRVQTSVRFFLRLVSGLTLGFGFLMAAFTRRRQALHDIAANTIVTAKPPELSPYALPARRTAGKPAR